MVRALFLGDVRRNVIKPFFLLFVLLGCTSALADAAAVVTHLAGTLAAKKSDGSSRLLSVRSEVNEGDTLLTEDKSYARIKFLDGAELVLKPNTTIEINKFRYKPENPSEDSSSISLIKGGLRSVSGALGKRNPDAVLLKTTVATIGIRGTHYGVLDCQADHCAGIQLPDGSSPPAGLHLDVADGRIRVVNSAGEQDLGAGQFAFVRDAATVPVVVPAEKGFRVLMPRSIAGNVSSGNTVGASREATSCSM